MNVLLGIDIGTTNSKVGAFSEQGQPLHTVSYPTTSIQHPQWGIVGYDPETMWQTIATAIQEVLLAIDQAVVKGIGISSMAESGLLVERTTGAPRSPFIPWFETCSEPQAGRIKRETDPFERFVRSGLHGSFKLGLAKILWIRDHLPEALDGGDPVWLSASSWIAYRLTGIMGFDYSLAARTYAFRIDQLCWDTDWIQHWSLSPSLFPQVWPGGVSIGTVKSEFRAIGLSENTEVTIAGHDHVAAALAVGAIHPGKVYDSMGTAETLVGTLPSRALTRDDFDSGLSFGVHIATGKNFWMGGQSASGGSVEWLRTIIPDKPLTYAQVLDSLEQVKPGPTGILYFPYLTGSGAPYPDAQVRGAFIGLSKSHQIGDLLKAALEGTAYQLQMMKRSAERLIGNPIDHLLVVGGGTRIPLWLSVKADITECTLELPGVPEASLLGAALAAGIGSQVFRDAEEAVAVVTQHNQTQWTTIVPNPESHEQYQKLYTMGFEPLQDPLRHYFKRVSLNL